LSIGTVDSLALLSITCIHKQKAGVNVLTFEEGPQQGFQIPLSRPFFPVNPAIPPFFAWKSQSRPLFKDVSPLIINLLNN